MGQSDGCSGTCPNNNGQSCGTTTSCTYATECTNTGSQTVYICGGGSCNANSQTCGSRNTNRQTCTGGYCYNGQCDTIPPAVSISGAPVIWQNSATASVKCIDTGGSGCDSGSYVFKMYPSGPGSCPQDYSRYTMASPASISSHVWICAAAKDNAGNAGFSSPVEFKIYNYIAVAETSQGGNLDFQGDNDYLNVLWNATYNPYLAGPLAATCWMNCPYDNNGTGFGDIESVCADYQNCTYIGVQGRGICTISNPDYDIKDNNMTCKFYHPTDQTILFSPYVNGTFRLINYRPVVQPGLSYTVGDKVPWRISVRNLGIFKDSYTINITNNNPNIVQVSQLVFTTETASRLGLVSVSPYILFLSSAPSALNILINSNSNRSICAVDAQCAYMGQGSICAPVGRCGINMQITTKGGFNSLPDFDVSGVLVIIVLSSLLFSAGIRRR